MIRKKILIVLFLALGVAAALFVLTACQGDTEKEAYYEVMLLDGKYFDVEKNVVSVKKGEDAVFDISIEDGYDFSDLSGGIYSDGKYILKDILYDRTVTLQAKKIVTVDFVIENGVAEISRILNDIGKLFIGSKVEIKVIADENYSIGGVSLNDSDLDIDIQAGKYSTFTVELEDVNIIDCNMLGDIYNLNINFNDNFGVIQYNKQDIYRYGDVVSLTAMPKSDYILNYWNFNGEIVTNRNSLEITIKAHTNLKVDFCSINAKRITYDANRGGVVSEVMPILGENGQSVYIDNGYKKFYRENHSLVGFNTKSDGTGISHSLGAMISVSDKYQVLYAMWEKWTDKEMFNYSLNNDGLGYTIKGFSEKGKNTNISKLVIPEQINGIPVTHIASYAFEGNDTIFEVVVGSSVSDIKSFAFYRMSQLYKITLFDNIRNIWHDSIEDNPLLDVLKINSATRRVYEYEMESSYVDKHMRLKTSAKKKIITVSGCSHARGLDASSLLQDVQLQEYDFIIMGVHAGYGLYHILETIEDYIGSGDIVIYSPELRHDMFGNQEGAVNKYIWRYLESNYDLTQEFSLKNNYGGKLDILSSFGGYIDYRKPYLDSGHQIAPSVNRFNSVDRYGYFDYYRPSSIEIGYEFNENAPGLFANKNLIGEGVANINAFASEVQSKGAKMYYTYPPVYRYKDYDNPIKISERADFETAISDALIFPVMGKVADFAYGPELLYEHVNHCSTTGVSKYTRDFKDAFKEQLIKDGVL